MTLAVSSIINKKTYKLAAFVKFTFNHVVKNLVYRKWPYFFWIKIIVIPNSAKHSRN
ncbi:hypothetical protein PSYMP_27688 [Pseudomonas amygdali pv. morsprunorum str. M302280]|nr:hypothetical protein PSYMP_27688 [Pseudomonas amygdali pv. morsprunorum str. M302280]